MNINNTQKNSKTISAPRLLPIEKPTSFKLKVAYWYTKKLFGRVITPLKVQYARFPQALGLSNELLKVQNRLTIDPRLKHLLKVYIATINGCAFCVDMGKALSQKKITDDEIFDNLLNWAESNRFSEAEKAALAYADEATRNKHVEDGTFERLREHFSEEEIIQITMLNAIENFYTLMNAPLNLGSDELCNLPAT